MPAVIIDKPSAANSPLPATEKMDDSRATRSNDTEGIRTNGNGHPKQESERHKSERDTDTEEGESEDGEGDTNAESSNTVLGKGHGGDAGEEDDEEDDDGDDDGDDEEEEEEEEEEEPSLKYERMCGAVNDLLKKDSASAVAVSNKCLVCSQSKYQLVCWTSSWLYDTRLLEPMVASYTCSI